MFIWFQVVGEELCTTDGTHEVELLLPFTKNSLVEGVLESFKCQAQLY